MNPNQQTIPVVVGVTGHRALRPEDLPALRAAVKAELQKIQRLCIHSQVLLLDSLAEGADLLCADAAEELGIGLIAALPMEREEFEKDFTPEGRARLRHHMARAEKVLVTPPIEAPGAEGSHRDYLFRQAGIYVVAHCHVMLALWDGGPGTPARCGTAEAVDFVLHGSYAPAAGVALRSDSNEAVIHIFTPRRDRLDEAAGTVHVLGHWEAVEDILRKTDEFNSQASAVDAGVSRLPAGAAEDDPCLARMERVGQAAGRLSAQSRDTYRRVLAALAVSSALLTFFFLMYDEAQAVWMILLCGVMLLSAWGCQRFAARSDCHRRYLEYRSLSECLRVQTYLRYAGSRVQASRLLTWSQQEETAWILDAMSVLSLGEPPREGHDIRECWVERQRRYHEKKTESAQKELDASERVVRFALILSITLYVAAVLFEFAVGSLWLPPVLRVGDAEWWRTVLKILLGTISAVTLFIANYYGRQSLPRVHSDAGKMERFYRKMGEQLEARGQSEELLTVLAREELIENGNWCSYQRDNKPDMSV